ncbi:unnamed protein product [Discosporangium mesarthrocarpum]
MWEWEGHKINYIDEGDPDQPALVLIHGFGASAYHWRYNVPALVAKGYRVLALDLLGFGLSDKPVIDYSAEIWRNQVCDFVKEIIGETREAVVMGNSLGGYTALSAAAALPQNIKGCVLLNAAGRFQDPVAEAAMLAMKDAPPKSGIELAWDNAVKGLSAAFQRAVVTSSFYFTKQPLRIKQVLTQVYIDPKNVDDELVESIRKPSLHPNAAEVFYRVIAKNGQGPPTTVDSLLDGFKTPLLLLWGEQDPWIQPAAADKIQAIHPPAKRVSVQAGHCPHDEAPEEVNNAMLEWLDSIGY